MLAEVRRGEQAIDGMRKGIRRRIRCERGDLGWTRRQPEQGKARAAQERARIGLCTALQTMCRQGCVDAAVNVRGRLRSVALQRPKRIRRLGMARGRRPRLLTEHEARASERDQNRCEHAHTEGRA
jgi:hypothetical protein